jgi:hypothetical protein
MKRGWSTPERPVKEVFDGSPSGFWCGVCHARGHLNLLRCSVLLPND